jgi:hypothetical protein
MMVNTTIVSRYTGTGVPLGGAHLKITGGPLYPRADVLDLIEKSTRISAPTKNGAADIAKLKLTDQTELADLLKDTVTRGRFISSEWCRTADDGPWAACDAYELKRKEWNEYAYKELEFAYYVKFCIGKTGQVILLISCHPPEDKRRHRK